MFEHPFGTLLEGEFEAVVEDPNGVAPNTIIQTDHDWQIKGRIRLAGVGAPFLCGEFHIEAYAEAIGPGPERQVGETTVVSLAATHPFASPRVYIATVKVPAGQLPEGVYRLATVLKHKVQGLPTEMAGFDETIIQVYKGLPS